MGCRMRSAGGTGKPRRESLQGGIRKDGITMGSLFDGIGGFPYAASFYGIRPLWASEIVPECISVTKRHFPGMVHMGDITLLHGGDLPPVDIITFGSPCQGLSTAGRRRGLADERSGLFMEAVRIIHEMEEATHGRYPRFALWENVPGALSSAGGRDYQAVLGALTKAEIPMPRSGRWADAGMVRGGGPDLAWCVYDARYFGTAQRRRRVFLVADFAGERAGEILFIPKSLRWYPEAGGTQGQGTPAPAEGRAGGTGREDGTAVGINGSLAGPLDASYYKGTGARGGRERDVVLCAATGQSNAEILENMSPTLSHACEQPYIAGQTGMHCVRRLTPLECERLQGFPDSWTGKGHEGQALSDTKRYQMLGNSIAVPCAAYIMQGMHHILAGTGGCP